MMRPRVYDVRDALPVPADHDYHRDGPACYVNRTARTVRPVRPADVAGSLVMVSPTIHAPA